MYSKTFTFESDGRKYQGTVTEEIANKIKESQPELFYSLFFQGFAINKTICQALISSGRATQIGVATGKKTGKIDLSEIV